MITIAEGQGEDSDAFWGGFFWPTDPPQRPLFRRLKRHFLALARFGTQRRQHTDKLAGILLVGWGDEREAVNGERLIDDVEFREALIHGDDDLRVQVLWYMKNWTQNPESPWHQRLIPFLKEVWPRQRAVRTARVSSKLVELALASSPRFPEIVTIILPWLTQIKDASLRLNPFLGSEENVAAAHPKSVLDLLWTILPDDPAEWPYNTGKLLSALSEAEDLADDPRLAELRRRQQLL